MSAAACKIIIDEAAAVVGDTLCLSGSAPVADAASDGVAVSPRLAMRYQRAASEYRRASREIIAELSTAIGDSAPSDGRPPSNVNRGETQKD